MEPLIVWQSTMNELLSAVTTQSAHGRRVFSSRMSIAYLNKQWVFFALGESIKID